MKSSICLLAFVSVTQFAGCAFAGDNGPIPVGSADAEIPAIEANARPGEWAGTNAAILLENQKLRQQLSRLASTTRVVFEGLKAEREAMQKQVDTLQAKLDVFEAQPVPFTPEELALFRRPETATLAVADKQSIDRFPSGAAELMADAQRLFGAHQFADTEQKYLEVLKLDPGNVYALGNLATTELEMNKTNAAETRLQEALAIKPADAFCLSTLGNLRFRQGKYDDAFDALSRAARLKPDDAEIQNFLGVTLSRKGQRVAAEAALRRAIQLDPQYGSAHNNLAVIYLTQTPPQIELARWHYQKALAAGQPRNEDLEKLFNPSDPPVLPPASQTVEVKHD